MAKKWQEHLKTKLKFDDVVVRAVSKNKIAVDVPAKDKERVQAIRDALQQLDDVEYTEIAPVYTVNSKPKAENAIL